MKLFTCFSLLFAISFGVAAQIAPDHSLWTELLNKHVDSTGHVSYSGFKTDSVRLNQYLDLLSASDPKEDWSHKEKLAFWINAYNAFTVKLIVEHYPVLSIKDIKKGVPTINSVWDLGFFQINGKSMTLNEIEHSILRKEFDEPRIHFAIVCASVSCPKLRFEAFLADRIEDQLEEQTISFINYSTKNMIDKHQLKLSSIFKWFRKDFTKAGSLKDFIRPFTKNDFDASVKVKFLPYDWRLNGD